MTEFVEGPSCGGDQGHLADVLDVERLVAKLSTGRVNARDLVALAGSLRIVEPLRKTLEGVYSSVLGDLVESLDPHHDVVSSIDITIADRPPMTIKEGGVIRSGVSEELDELRQIAGDGKAWMARFQADAIERYQIPGLKIGFNNVFGYYLEVPRGQVGHVPDEFVRKQTLKNAERYITPELKEFEDKVLRAEERAKDMEYEIFTALKDEVAAEVPRILATARALAEIDAAGLAQTAATPRYCAPTVDGGDRIEIQAGRHPVIEATQTDVTFVERHDPRPQGPERRDHHRPEHGR